MRKSSKAGKERKRILLERFRRMEKRTDRRVRIRWIILKRRLKNRKRRKKGGRGKEWWNRERHLKGLKWKFEDNTDNERMMPWILSQL